MEPWDGPAMVSFTNGDQIGATLDRNGLRPSRYYVTEDDRVLLSSEIGVIPEILEEEVVVKSRLEPGKILLVDFKRGEIIKDEELKKTIAQKHPYQWWMEKNYASVTDWEQTRKDELLAAGGNQAPECLWAGGKDEHINHRLNMFGWTTETLDMMLLPMVTEKKDPLGSMGSDTPLAVLSEFPKMPFEYFQQLFAQVTNPPIDPLREASVMSLECPVGPERNILDVAEGHAARLQLKDPVLTMAQMDAIKNTTHGEWRAVTIDATYAPHQGVNGMLAALDRIDQEVSAAVSQGAPVIVLSHRGAGEHRIPIPSLLACGSVHQHLLRTRARSHTALFVEAGDVREVHDFCTLLGFGCDGINPYQAMEAIDSMNDDGMVNAAMGDPNGPRLANTELHDRYAAAAGKGMLKVFAKMGICTLQSYKGAQIFEAVGLGDEVMERCFAGTASRISGVGFEGLHIDFERLHRMAYPAQYDALAGEQYAVDQGAGGAADAAEDAAAKAESAAPLLYNPGMYHLRHGGEAHLNTPNTIVGLQMASRTGDRDAYKAFVRYQDEQAARVTIRGLLKFKEGKRDPVPLEDVEPAKDIVKRFVTGAMSLGSLSTEAHEVLAVAMNRLGGKSNTGEGGEDPGRFADERRSSIKQVASGRFGVTSNYLANADELQIKMAQGAKPGEGGELPGSKVFGLIAETRRTTEGVGLISPPPHHDIYSIEDLAQLIRDLKASNPVARVSVKLVSEVGVGVVAAGVSKALADHVTISGYDGGTGAAAWTGIKHCGLPWELGLAEAQQTLVLNNLRSRVTVQTDSQLRTGKDVVTAALLGAEEFGFSTAPLIAIGCIMMRKCHLNTCPVGVATQDPELRAKFEGQPEHVINYFFLLAEEIREYMAELGFTNMQEMIGRSDYLEMDPANLHYKSRNIDLSDLLVPSHTLNQESPTVFVPDHAQDHKIAESLDCKPGGLIEQAMATIEGGAPCAFGGVIDNADRSVGATLSYEVSKRYGDAGLPDHSIKISLTGHGGQSLAFALAPGITMEVLGDANDYAGKGLSGGHLYVHPTQGALDAGFVPEEHVVTGNACLYGATGGQANFRGKAGERFAVRNSGATAVVEGVGDHGCEYMTGGVVVCLGATGDNFAAGMSGGVAFMWDPNRELFNRCNHEMVGLEENTEWYGEDAELLQGYLRDHLAATGSGVAERLLADWPNAASQFVKVIPHEYKAALERTRRADMLPESSATA
jgi:glutamate synthase domain-containing protein 2/glutamate synthase domain-containing protein 3